MAACKCNIPCPCEFAQPPTNNECRSVLAWHIRKGEFGQTRLDGFNLLALGAFTGNIWAGAKAAMGLFIDERADARQREALQTIFGGQAGGWPGAFSATIGEFRGIEFVPISFELASDLAFWKAEIPGRVKGTEKRSQVRRLRPASVSRRSMRLAPKWGRGRSPPGAARTMSGRKASASNGPTRTGRASTYPSTGPDLTRVRSQASSVLTLLRTMLESVMI
jgi:hypothetical protein